MLGHRIYVGTKDCDSWQAARQADRAQTCPPPTHLTPQINSEPYGTGWMMKIELSNKGEADSLLDSAAYQKHCEH